MNKRTVILDVVAAPLFWFILATSLWILFRGHNEPGGGFIGGLIAVSASTFYAIVKGTDAARKRLPLRDPIALASVGILIALASGVPSLLSGEEFLKHHWTTLSLAMFDFEIGTPLVFDIGVYISVWGALCGYSFGLLGMDMEEST